MSRHIMFINAQAYTDPNDVACGKENPKIVMTGLTHKNYYSSSFYKAPFDFVIKPSETITVHFNAPPAHKRRAKRVSTLSDYTL